MTTGYIMLDNPRPDPQQGTYPRRGGAKLSGTAIVHTSEGGWRAGVDSLTNLVRTRADYGCYHQACDWADIARYYPWEWETWQDTETNNWAVGIAAACRTTDWGTMPADVEEGYYRNMARMAADFVIYMRDVHKITVPLRRLSGAEARARVPGFCAHGDSGIARSDPGANFNWTRFFDYTRQALAQGTEKEWFEMPLDDATKAQIHEAVWGGPGIPLMHNYRLNRGEWPKTILGALERRIQSEILLPLQQQVTALNAQVTNLIGAVAALAGGEDFDEAKLLAGVRTAAEQGVKSAIDSIETTVKLAVPEPETPPETPAA